MTWQWIILSHTQTHTHTRMHAFFFLHSVMCVNAEFAEWVCVWMLTDADSVYVCVCVCVCVCMLSTHFAAVSLLAGRQTGVEFRRAGVKVSVDVDFRRGWWCSFCFKTRPSVWVWVWGMRTCVWPNVHMRSCEWLNHQMWLRVARYQ